MNLKQKIERAEGARKIKNAYRGMYFECKAQESLDRYYKCWLTWAELHNKYQDEVNQSDEEQ